VAWLGPPTSSSAATSAIFTAELAPLHHCLHLVPLWVRVSVGSPVVATSPTVRNHRSKPSSARVRPMGGPRWPMGPTWQRLWVQWTGCTECLGFGWFSNKRKIISRKLWKSFQYSYLEIYYSKLSETSFFRFLISRYTV
jgi:hypothetical protein